MEVHYKVGIYIRLSKEDVDKKRELESESIVNQRNLLLSYLDSNHLSLVDEYVDDGFSGTTFDRPNFLRLIDDIEKGKINMVVTKDLSRLGRDYIQSGYYLEQYFPMKKVRYVSILDQIDTFLDSSQNDIAPFKSLFNDMQSKDTSRKIRSILRNKKEHGEFLGSSPSFGFLRDPNDKHHLILDPNTAPIVRRIFDLALQGKSGSEICLILNQDKVITPLLYKKRKVSNQYKNPGLWTNSSVRNILSNFMYTGSMVQGVQAKLNYKSKKRILLDSSQWIIVSNTHDSIVSEEEFYFVNQKSSFRRKLKKQRDKLLLEGLVFCKECGCTLGIRLDRRNSCIRYSMNCNRYTRNPKLHLCESHFISYDRLEMEIVNRISKKLKQIDLKFLYSQLSFFKVNSKCEKWKEEVYMLEKEKLELFEKIKEIHDEKFHGTIHVDIYMMLLKDFENRLHNIKERLMFLKNSIEEKSGQEISVEQFMKRFLNKGVTRELLAFMVNKILVSKNKEIDVYYNFKE